MSADVTMTHTKPAGAAAPAAPAPRPGSTGLDAAIERICSVYVGDPMLVRKVLAAALANGHVLFEDNPGLGKTLLMKLVSQVLGCHGSRVQFTPDVLPGDILGAKVWDAKTGEFRLEKGPVFTNVLLADEINRAPPKSQSALLEVMEERQVTIEGETIRLAPPFFVLATQNPVEQEGTYPLPEAQLDRFLLRLRTGYPRDTTAEVELLRRRISWGKDDPTRSVEPVMDAASFHALQQRIETGINVSAGILDYIARMVRALREHPGLEVGPSPRGSLALLRISRAMALLGRRDYVTPDDVRVVAVEALAHRCIVDVDHAMTGATAEAIVRDVLKKAPIPGATVTL